jgi:hypothetical protein
MRAHGQEWFTGFFNISILERIIHVVDSLHVMAQRKVYATEPMRDRKQGAFRFRLRFRLHQGDQYISLSLTLNLSQSWYDYDTEIRCIWINLDYSNRSDGPSKVSDSLTLTDTRYFLSAPFLEIFPTLHTVVVRHDMEAVNLPSSSPSALDPSLTLPPLCPPYPRHGRSTRQFQPLMGPSGRTWPSRAIRSKGEIQLFFTYSLIVTELPPHLIFS